MARYNATAVESAARACAAAVQDAETAMTVRLQWTHAEILGEGEGVLIAGFSLVDIGRIASYCDVTEEAQGIPLVAAFVVLTGKCQRMLGKGVCLLQAVCPQIRLT